MLNTLLGTDENHLEIFPLFLNRLKVINKERIIREYMAKGVEYSSYK